MKYLSTFSGIGAPEKAIENLGLNFECVGFSEIDKYAVETYKKNFPDHKNLGDITKIDEKNLPDFDLFIGGFPCQAFSIAGKRGGFEDTRGTLFFDCARIIKHKQPKYVILENVRGLLSHEDGKTFSTIIAALWEIGYAVDHKILNSKNFGVPQNRERIFIVCRRADTITHTLPDFWHFHWAEKTDDTKKLVDILEEKADKKYFLSEKMVNGLMKKGEKEFINQDTQASAVHNTNGICPTLSAGTHGYANGYIKQLNNPKHSNDRIYSDTGICPTLNTMQGGNRQPFVSLTERRTEEGKAHRREKGDKGVSRRVGKKLEPRTDGVANCLTANLSQEHYLSNGIQVRRLTPLECERLQGFPDDWTAGNSETQRYKQCGNSMTVSVLENILKNLEL